MPEKKSEKSTWTDSFGNVYVNVHSENMCTGRPCVIHAPSNHLMKDWPVSIRTDIFKYALAERHCAHGIGHPDPDSIAYFKAVGDSHMGIHGCDSCCTGGLTVPKTAFGSVPEDPDLIADVDEILTGYMKHLEEEWDAQVKLFAALLASQPSAQEPGHA